MHRDFQLINCKCGEIHVPARDGEPCAKCRYEAKKFFVPPEETEHVPDETPDQEPPENNRTQSASA